MLVSTYRKVYQHSPIQFPEFTGLRVIMMPIELGSMKGIPKQYQNIMKEIYGMTESRLLGQVGYLTIEEREVKAGKTLRRPRKHVDGFYQGRCGAWGGGGSYGSVGNGMFVLSSTSHCRAWLGYFDQEPDENGDCEHFNVQGEGELFEANQVYWLDGACVHESLPVEEDTVRQFIRVSMPNNGAWFEGYTKNPEGVLPTGEILPERTEFMKFGDK